MQNFIEKTFKGLTPQYYWRQFFFGLLFVAFIYYASTNATLESPSTNWPTILFAVVLAFLYPYSRFVYESIIHFIVGDNIIFGEGIFMLLMLVVKVITMFLCFVFAWAIAPLGLLYLYYVNSRH